MANVGRMNCICCGLEMPARTGEKGALNVSCPWCGLSAYAREGTQAKKLLMPKVRPDPAQQPLPADPKAEPKVTPKAEAGAKKAMPWM